MKQPKQHPYSRLLKPQSHIDAHNEMGAYVFIASFRLFPGLLAAFVTTGLSFVIGFWPGTIFFGIILVWVVSLYARLAWAGINVVSFHLIRLIGWAQSVMAK